MATLPSKAFTSMAVSPVRVLTSVFLSTSIGKDCQICNHFTAVSEGPGIEIGDKVLVGTAVTVMDSDFHDISPEKRIEGTPKTGKVVIADNVWIGDRVTILKGSTIGRNLHADF